MLKVDGVRLVRIDADDQSSESSRGSENTVTGEPLDEVPADTVEARSRSQASRKVTIEPEKKVVFRSF